MPVIFTRLTYFPSISGDVMTMASTRGSSSSTWCKSLEVLSLLLCLLSSSSHVTLAQENGEETNTENGFTGPTTQEVFHIDLKHKESTTSSITIGWKVPNGYEVSEYEVVSRKTSSNATTYSGPLDPEEDQYLISDLARNTEYEICVKAKVELDEDAADEEEQVCKLVFTIPLVLVSSLVVLFCVLGYIALMILIGYCVWKRHTNKILAEQAEKEEEEEKMKTNEQPQTYLGAPANNAPKSSIEDQDIPYITPPVEQLSPSEKDQYKKALV